MPPPVLGEEHAIGVIGPPGTCTPDIIGPEALRKISAGHSAANIFEEPAHETSLASIGPAAKALPTSQPQRPQRQLRMDERGGCRRWLAVRRLQRADAGASTGLFHCAGPRTGEAKYGSHLARLVR